MKNLLMMIILVFFQLLGGKKESRTDMLKNLVGLMGFIGSPNCMIN